MPADALAMQCRRSSLSRRLRQERAQLFSVSSEPMGQPKACRNVGTTQP